MATEIERPMKAKAMFHKDIAKLAKEMAGAHYEELARDNRFYKSFPTAASFVARHWVQYTHIARQTFTLMLGDPNRSEEQKAAIADVLLKDGAINPKRMSAPEKPRFFLGPT